MRVFITGESGCIASALIKTLKKFGYYITNQDQDVQDFIKTWKWDGMHQSFSNRKPEVNVCNYQTFEKVIAVANPDIIIHTAAYVGTCNCKESPEKCIESNVLGTFNVIAVCKKFDIKLVHFSSTTIYDADSYSNNQYTDYWLSKFNEKTNYRPRTLYGITKLDSELQVHNLINKEDVIIVRPVFVYGDYPNDSMSMITKILYNGYHNTIENKNEELIVKLHLKYFKDYMRVEDCADAIVHVIRKNIWGEDFNIGFGSAKTFQNIFQHIKKTYIGNYNVKFLGQFDYLKNHIPDVDKIKSTGWTPKITLEEGLDMTYSSIVRNKDIEPDWWITKDDGAY